MVILKGSYVYGDLKKCDALVGAETVLSSAGPQTTPFHGGLYRAENGNM